MNYQKVYDQIIDRAKTRQIEGYVEKHHIIPKCLGGNNEQGNLVKLTAREHFICHMLLCEMYPNSDKLKQALWLMSIGKQSKNVKIKINGRIYQKLKENISIINRIQQLNKKDSEETKRKKSINKIGKKQSLETILKRSSSLKGRIHSDESNKKRSEALKNIPRPYISEKLKGNKHSEKTKQKMSEAKLGKKLTDHHKQKISRSNKGKIKHSFESKQILRKKRLGKKLSNETKSKIYTLERNKKISSKLKNRKFTQEHIDKLSQIKIGKTSNASKPILQYDLQGNFIKEWKSISEAKKWLGKGDIQGCVLNKQKTAGGYIWKFKK